MKKILCAILLSLFMMPARAVDYDSRSVFISAAAFEDALNKYVKPEYQAAAAQAFLDKRNPQNGTVLMLDMINVCIAGHITYCLEHPGASFVYSNGSTGHCSDESYGILSIEGDTCDKFMEYVLSNSRGAPNLERELTADICAEWNGKWVPAETGGYKCVGADGYLLKYSYACKKNKKGKCESLFKNIRTTQMIAMGLINEYGIQQGKKFTCMRNPTKRDLVTQWYVQCTAGGEAYEFEFDKIGASSDAFITESVEVGVCKIYGVKYSPSGMTLDTAYSKGETWASACETTDNTLCGKINTSLMRFGRSANISLTGSKRNQHNACVIYNNSITSLNQLHTAFGIDNWVFKNSGIQLNATTNLKDQICNYVRNTVTNPEITSCECNDGFVTLYNFDSFFTETDDVLTCRVNGKTVDFVFDDLSESKGLYDKAGREAMNCITWGGTYTGKQCIGLDEQMCNTVREANEKYCPECKLVRWNNGICELPTGVDATNLKKGLNYAAIVGGTVLGIVVTVGTLGTADAPVALVLTGLGVETLGAGIELKAQIDINNTAEEFFAQSAKCNDRECAEDLIIRYLKRLSNQQNDMLEEELSAADAELARLADIIPGDSYFYQVMFANGTDLASNDDGEWTSDQVWRAVGIGFQLTSVFVGIGKWIIKKTSTLQRCLRQTTIAFGNKGKIAIEARRVAVANMVDYDKLDDVGKEWYKLWKKYAPRNQTFDEFKAMTNGNLDEMRELAKKWRSWDEIDMSVRDYNLLKEKEQRFITEHSTDYQTMSRDEFRLKYPEYDEIMTQLNDLEPYRYGNYSTNDLEFRREFQEFIQKNNELDEWWYKEYPRVWQKFMAEGQPCKWGDYYEYKQLVSEYNTRYQEVKNLLPSQWQLAEEFQLRNIVDVVEERVRLMNDVLASNPELESKITEQVWAQLNENERLDIAQQIIDKYADKLGTPRARLFIDRTTTAGGYYKPGTYDIYFNPNAQFAHGGGYLKDVLAHEYGHLIDYMFPNKGALGSQYSYYASKIYDSAVGNGYYAAFTEQSSFAIGNATKDGLYEVVDISETLDPVAAGVLAGSASGAGVGYVVDKKLSK